MSTTSTATGPAGAPSARIIRSTGVVLVVAACVKLLGFVEKVVMAYYFGTGPAIDAYLVAFSVPFMAYLVVREIVEPSFLPPLVDCVRNGQHAQAWKLFSVTTSTAMLVLFAVSIAGVVTADALIAVLAPGFDGETRRLAVHLTRIVCAAALPLGLSAVTYITLNSYKRFAVPALGDVAFKAMPIAALLAAGTTLGVDALAVGLVGGALARLVVHLAGMRGSLRAYRFTLDVAFPPAVRMRRLMTPLLLGIAFSQMSSIVDTMFASTLQTGSISALSYARKLVDMPVLILPYSLGIVLFPYFAEMSLSRQAERLEEMFLHALKVTALVFAPLAVGLIVLREPLVRLVFERGAFDTLSRQMTSSALPYFAAGLFAFAVEAIIVQLYFSMSDTRTPVLVGIGCVLLHVVLTYLFIQIIQHRGVALALTLSKTVKVALLYGLLRIKMPSMRLSRPLAFFGRVSLSALLMGLVVGALLPGLQWAVKSVSESVPVNDAAVLLSATLVGVGVYALALALMRDADVRFYARYVREKRFLAGS